MIRLKNPELTIYVYGFGDVHNENITPELYQRLIDLNPNLEEFFEVTQDEDDEEEFG
jgi:hypothetical protein